MSLGEISNMGKGSARASVDCYSPVADLRGISFGADYLGTTLHVLA